MIEIGITSDIGINATIQKKQLKSEWELNDVDSIPK